jgi:hypothetical protein
MEHNMHINIHVCLDKMHHIHWQALSLPERQDKTNRALQFDHEIYYF